MLRQRFKRVVAQAVAVLVFSLSVWGPVGAVGHVHHNGTDHASLHSSLVCIWMCAASSFVGLDGASLNASLVLVERDDVEPAALLLGNRVHNFHTRAPPLHL